MVFRKGSTMVMVISTIGILTILGLAISTMAAVNFKYKKVEETRKKSYYSAEAGFDQAYSFVASQIEKAISKGTENVEEQTTVLKDSIRADFEKNGITENNRDYINADGIFKEEKFVEKFQNWFEEGYTEYLNGEVPYLSSIGSIAEALKHKIYDKVNSTYASPPLVSVIDTNTPLVKPVPFAGASSTFSIPLRSEFSLINNDIVVTRKLEATLDIKIPKFEDVSRYNVKSLTVKIEESPLLFKSLVADGNIIINPGSNVVVNGNAYAYRGVDIAGELTINNGLISTTGDIKTTLSGSTFKTVNSDVFCSNLQILKGTSNCTINVKGNVNTKDDIELNGTNAKVDINGNYYGFSDGAHGNSHDQSSSIVINSTDIASRSYINITGDTYILGTVYIGNDAGYQTGESVSVKGNYKAYSTPLTGLTNTTQDPSKQRFNSDNINFTYESPLLLATSFLDTNANLNVADKSKYINYFQSIIGGLNLGNGNIKVGTVKHSLGAFIDNASLHPALGGVIETVSQLSTKKINDYNYHKNLLDNKWFLISDSGSENESLGTNNLMIADWVNMSNRDKSGKIINDYIFADKSAGHVNATIYNDDDKTRIVIVGVNGNANPAMVEGDQSTNTKRVIVNTSDISSTNSYIQGAIFTKGNVYVTGDINYTGIIAAGNIIFADAGNKTFTANAEVAERCIFKAEIENSANPLDFYNKFTPMNIIDNKLKVGRTNYGITFTPNANTDRLYNADISVGGVTSYSTVGTLALFRNMKRVY